MDTLIHVVTHYGYAGIFVLLMLGIVGLPVPDETLLAFAGYLVGAGHLRFSLTLASAFLGSCCGITISYVLGRTLGYEIRSGRLRILHINKERMEQAHQWFERVGRWALTLGYFVPGVRHLTAFMAGTGKLEKRSFALFAYSGALLWSSTFISLGYFLRDEWERGLGRVQRDVVLTAIVLFVAVLLYFHFKRKQQAKSRG